MGPGEEATHDTVSETGRVAFSGGLDTSVS